MEKPALVIVDDDADYLEELGELIRASGYEVKAVSDPLRAVTVIERTRPDAVLLDLKMDEKDGFEIARELSENPSTAGIPVIVITGYYNEEELEVLKSSGVVRSFLTKPLVVSDLLAKLEMVRGPV
jgi:two-component system response regulator GlrR